MKNFKLVLVLSLCAAFLALAPARAWAEAESSSSDEEGGGMFSWVSQMKVKMMATQYGLDTATTEKLMAILKQESTDKKKVNGEIRSIMTEMDKAMTAGAASDHDMLAKIDQIQSKKMELANIENRTLTNVVELLGPKKAAQWILSRRGVVDRMSGAVRHAGQQNASDTAAERPAQHPRRGNW